MYKKNAGHFREKCSRSEPYFALQSRLGGLFLSLSIDNQ